MESGLPDRLPQNRHIEEPSSERLYSGDFDNVSTPEEFIAAIDFDTLNTIFDEIQRKSIGDGPISATEHRVTPEKISFMESTHTDDGYIAFGEATTFTGEIELWWETDERYFSESELVRALLTLKTLMDEAAHIRGSYKSERSASGHGHEYVARMIVRKGISESHIRSDITGGYITEVGVSLNEAITENLAYEAMHEYLIRTGNSGYLKDKSLVKKLGYGSYNNDRLALAVVIRILSVTLDTSIGDLWKGFVHAYMSGNTELCPLLSQLESEISHIPEIAELLPMLARDEALDPENALLFENILDRIADPKKYELPLLKIAASELRVRLIDEQRLSASNFKNVLGLR